jgi:FXSXX-COOH protein
MPSVTLNQALLVSSLADIRDTPLADLAEMSPGVVDQAIRRVLPESPVAPVPVAAFQSAI